MRKKQKTGFIHKAGIILFTLGATAGWLIAGEYVTSAQELSITDTQYEGKYDYDDEYNYKGKYEYETEENQESKWAYQNEVNQEDEYAYQNEVNQEDEYAYQKEENYENEKNHADDVGAVLKDWDYTETQDSIILAKYIGTSTDIVIPGSIDGKQVFLQNSGAETGADRFPENTTSIVVGSAEQKVKVTDGKGTRLFSGLTKLIRMDARGLDTSDMTSMYRMFFDCNNLVSLEISGWDTGRVTNMNYMFQACNSLVSVDVSGWDTSNVTSMYSMFRGCNSLTGLDVSSWDTGNVTDMSCMFYSCSSLTGLDLSKWNTSNITGDNIDSMFYNCNSLTWLDVNGWDTSRIMSMQNLFFNCSSLRQLDLSSWDTGNVVSMNYMFYYCSSLTELNMNGWDTSKVGSILYMFYNCSKLQILDLTGHDYSGVMTGWAAGVFDLVDTSAALPTLIISNDSLIQEICDGPVAGRVPAGPTYHFGEGTFTDAEGNVKTTMQYFDTLSISDIRDFTVQSIINKYVPEKDGAVFSGWFLEEAHTRPFETEADSMSLIELINANLYAKYQNQYTVIFVDHDGSIIKESLVLEGDSATAPEENPVREGYVFTGWDREFENVTENLVIKALYEEEKAPGDADEEEDGNDTDGEEDTDEDADDGEDEDDEDEGADREDDVDDEVNDVEDVEEEGNVKDGTNEEDTNDENTDKDGAGQSGENQENTDKEDAKQGTDNQPVKKDTQNDDQGNTEWRIGERSIPETADTSKAEFYIFLLFVSFMSLMLWKKRKSK